MTYEELQNVLRSNRQAYSGVEPTATRNLSIADILSGIQSQYTPPAMGAYGAKRFIDPNFGFDQQHPKYEPPTNTLPTDSGGEFYPGTRIPKPKTVVVPAAVAPTSQITSSGDGGGYDGVATQQSNDAYSSLFSPISPLAKGLIGLAIPGASPLLGAVQGYAQAEATNNLNTALGAYGHQGFGKASGIEGALKGIIGMQPSEVQQAQALSNQFSDPASMFGYFSAFSDPSVSDIAQSLMSNKGNETNLTPDQMGVIGWSVGQSIHSNIANGMTVQDAVQTAAENFGVSPSQAAAFGVNAAVASGDTAAKSDPIGALIGALNLSPEAPAQTATQTEAATQAVADESAQNNAESNGYDSGGYDYGGGYDSGGGYGGDSGGGDSGGGGDGWAKGGYVDAGKLIGMNPAGADDGYGALDDGEFVIKASAVKKYGVGLLGEINAGKISKKKLMSLL